jgi:hypothetical protein
MPGRKWYVIAFVLILVGAALAGFVAYRQLNGLTNHLPQVVVPGQADLTLSRAGTYTIYLEREAVVNGRLYAASDAVDGMRVRVSSAAGSPIEMTRPSVNSNYSLGGRSGSAVLAFTVAEPGQYRLGADYPDGSLEPQAVLAVGFGVPQRILTAIATVFGIAGVGFVLGAIVAIVTFLKRRSVRRHAVAATGPAASP